MVKISSSIPGWRIKILHAPQSAQNLKKKNNLKGKKKVHW